MTVTRWPERPEWGAYERWQVVGQTQAVVYVQQVGLAGWQGEVWVDGRRRGWVAEQQVCQWCEGLLPRWERVFPSAGVAQGVVDRLLGEASGAGRLPPLAADPPEGTCACDSV